MVVVVVCSGGGGCLWRWWWRRTATGSLGIWAASPVGNEVCYKCLCWKGDVVTLKYRNRILLANSQRTARNRKRGDEVEDWDIKCAEELSMRRDGADWTTDSHCFGSDLSKAVLLLVWKTHEKSQICSIIWVLVLMWKHGVSVHLEELWLWLVP